MLLLGGHNGSDNTTHLCPYRCMLHTVYGSQTQDEPGSAHLSKGYTLILSSHTQVHSEFYDELAKWLGIMLFTEMKLQNKHRRVIPVENREVESFSLQGVLGPFWQVLLYDLWRNLAVLCAVLLCSQQRWVTPARTESIMFACA